MKTIIFKFYITALTIALITISCTKVIDLKLSNNAGKLVIEGNITNIPGPQYIKLSQSVPFTNTNDYPPVTGAMVKVTDQAGNNYQFTEGPSGTYSVNALTGISGSTYTMTVLSNGKSYTAISSMPAQIALDSVTSKKSDFNNSKNLKAIIVHFKDPVGIPNWYRFILHVNGVQVKRVFALNDDFTDGRYISTDLSQDDIDIHSGDTVTVEMQCIDKTLYTYWYTLMQQQQNGAGGGVNPSNPPNNITPTTLGYFSAHTTQTKTIVVK